MKKILFISHMYPTSFDKSYGKVIHEQALSLKERGYEIKVICPIPFTLPFLNIVNEKYRNYNLMPKKEIHDSIEVYYPRYLSFPKSFLFKYSGTFMFKGIINLVKKVISSNNIDIIHAHFTMPDAYAGMKISKMFNIPLITTIQATDLDISVNRNIQTRKKIQGTLMHSESVITPTPRLEKQLKSLFDINSSSIGYGINLDKIVMSSPRNLTKKYENELVLISVSRLINSKGLEYNIRAIKELKIKYFNIKYLIVGDGPYKEILSDLVNELELTKSVEFLGNLNQQQTMEYISIADIFCLPSWQETFGLVYLEAMAHAIPVIGCEGQGFDGIITHAEDGFLARPKDIKSIVEIIDYIIKNPIESKRISHKGKEIVDKDFTFEEISKKISLIYENV